jgi:broad specificity phosphatase PhoE
LAQSTANYLANNTVLIVRHAEKPESGTGLTPLGEARARLYAKYFEPFQEDGLSIPVDCLYAGADSKNSIRPRLTLEPLSKATGLPLHLNVGTKESAALVLELKTEAHGRYPLVAWRHGEIPALLTAFGASPEKLLPNGRWPDDVFDWVIVLTIGPDGQLASAKVIHEQLKVPVLVP